jgi:hypothetical protein
MAKTILKSLIIGILLITCGFVVSVAAGFGLINATHSVSNSFGTDSLDGSSPPAPLHIGDLQLGLGDTVSITPAYYSYFVSYDWSLTYTVKDLSGNVVKNQEFVYTGELTDGNGNFVTQGSWSPSDPGHDSGPFLIYYNNLPGTYSFYVSIEMSKNQQIGLDDSRGTSFTATATSPPPNTPLVIVGVVLIVIGFSVPIAIGLVGKSNKATILPPPPPPL